MQSVTRGLRNKTYDVLAKLADCILKQSLKKCTK